MSQAHRPVAALLLSLAAALCCPSALALQLSDELGPPPSGEAPLFEEAAVPLQLIEAAMLEDREVTELVASGALAMLGTRYKWGGKGGENVDCSKLVQQAYRAAGVEIPRTTREQVRVGVPVAASELRKGDLLFYRWQRRGLHVAVYMDDGYILHASPGKGRVVMTRLNKAWQRRMVAARRVVSY